MLANTSTLKTFIVILSVLMSCSACLTSFKVGQEAHTLPKHTLETGAEFGGFKLSGGVRYGILDKLDGGVYYNTDFMTNDQDKFPSLSADVKWQLSGSTEKNFVLSSGIGFGTGVERTTLWNELAPYYSTEDAWYLHGGSSVDGYLPLYLSAYLHDSRFLYSFNFNPYLVYRFGFYQKIHDSNGHGFHFDYRKMDKGFLGAAFSVIISDKHRSLAVGVLNFLYSNSQSENFEIYWTYSHKFNLERKQKRIHAEE